MGDVRPTWPSDNVRGRGPKGGTAALGLGPDMAAALQEMPTKGSVGGDGPGSIP